MKAADEEIARAQQELLSESRLLKYILARCDRNTPSQGAKNARFGADGASTLDTIFEKWRSEHAELFGNWPILLRHRLHQNLLFSEMHLAEVIDRYNRDGHRYLLTHMGPLGSPKQSWKEYKIGDMPGKRLIERIRSERLWISLHDI